MSDQQEEAPELELEDDQPLDPEILRRREQALKLVRQFGDPVLRTTAIKLDVFDQGFKDDIKRMAEIMDDALGIGLAATQVGLMKRFFIYRLEPDGPLQVLCNAQVEPVGEDEEIMEEGCLSLADVRVDVKRPTTVKVKGQDIDGQEVEFTATGLEARVIQHENDHLDGILIIDRCPKEQRKAALETLHHS